MSDTEPTINIAADGELPEGWEISALGAVAKWGSGGTPKAGTSSYYGGEIPWAVISDLNEGIVTATAQSITELGLAESSAKLIQPGSVLVAMYGSIGKTGIAGQPMATNQAIAFAVPHPLMMARDFLHLYLKSQRESFLAAGKGGTQANISQTILKAWPIPVPPITEQERIVEILEEQLSRLDAALESVRVVREKAAQFRRSLLHAAFTGTLTGHNPTDGQLPEGWEVSPLGELATLSLGKMLDKKQFTGLNPVTYLRNINVRWDEFDLNDMQVMDITPEQFERVSLQSGDIVVCEGGEPGRSAVWLGSEPIAIQKALHRVRPHKNLNPRFLYFLLEMEFRGSGDHPLFTGTTIKHLPKEKIATVQIPVPPLTEQEQIVEILEEQLSRLDAALAVADAIEKRSAALRRSLLHAAFTGRLTEKWRESVHV